MLYAFVCHQKSAHFIGSLCGLFYIQMSFISVLIEVSRRSFGCAFLCTLLISGTRIVRTKQRIINRSFRKENTEDLDSGLRVPSLPTRRKSGTVVAQLV